MKKTKTLWTRALAGAVALLFVTFLSAPPAFAAATIEVSQLEGLKDGQSVTISGAGFSPGMKEIAVGQCVEGANGPSMCNIATGATFKDADGSGNIASLTIVVKEKFGSYDCTTQQCTIGAQPLPGTASDAEVAANTVYHNISFGDVAAAPAAEEAPAAAPAAAGEELPKTGPGQEIALALVLGTLMLLLGGATLWFMPRRGNGVV
ncbi:neocarzinostatin apoprotein domain-containing protein [Nocardioides gilvus]|uniref:neocarzinostatin apoprotein domain-containing protein n=1 Tax=Nocardioides gilvus TaxID=1735589 RepID=UPI0013A52D41|nr:neocarzinostatin apoprotein domain-containing protein [Nocardioides gilvus]